MKNEITKVKHVKPIWEKLQKFYLQLITDACVKIAVLEICFEKKATDSVVGSFKNTCAVAVLWYERCFCRNLSTNFWKKRKKKPDDILAASYFHLNSKIISKSSSSL